VAEAPEVFDLSDDEVVHILLAKPPTGLEPSVIEAVSACPKQALRIVTD
jgi:ferredoxin